MKLTEQVEAEIRQVMNDYWSSYFEGNLDHWAAYLVDDYRNIGGTEEEVWNSKNEILDYTYRIIDQIKGATELRNKQVQLIPYDPYVMVHELLDIYIKVEDEWTFYQKFRLSSLLQKTPEGWKVLHQHGSYPDSKTTEGEAFAFDTLKSENLKLQKAIKERTIELEAKNRELEIETAVEKVRAQSLGMYQTSDFSKVTRELYEQLNRLQIEGFTGVSIYEVDENDIVKVWDLSSPGNLANANDYAFSYDAKKYPVFGDWVESWRNSTEEYLLLDFPLDQLKMGVNELKEILPEMAVHLADAIASGNLKHQWNPSGRFSGGMLSVDLVTPPTADIKKVVCKMAGAFNLAYQRFLDLKNAEAQTREARIETALEKVRAVAMSMHKQDDMLGICKALYDELKSLGFTELRNALIHSFVDEKMYFIDYDYSDATKGNISRIPYTGNPVIEKFIKSIRKSSDSFFEYTLQKKELQDWIAFRKQNNEADDPRLENIKSLHYYNYSVGTSGIGISTYEPITKEQQGVLERFKNVFQLAYQRYSDISWAEAQAREAQINLAVERVRARALAMFKSEEILEVVFKLKEEVMNLNIPNVMAATIHMVEKDGKHRMWDISSMESIEGKLHLPLDISYHIEETDPNLFIRRVWGETERYFLVTQDEKDLKRTLQWLKDNGKAKEADEAEEFIRATGLKILYHPTIQLNSGRMSIDLLEPPSGEIESILTKMGAAFDLAYTRFEDLKNSEAQLKEAQTEAALEKVRARTMAMQHSDELADASRLLEEEVRKLGIETWGCAFHIYDEENTDELPWDLEWFTSPAGMLPFYKTPRENVFLKYYNESKKGTKLHIEEIGPNEIKKHYDYLKSIPIMGDALMEMSRAGVPLPQIQFDHVAFFKQGHLLFITYKPVPEAHDIFIRFAKIFDQTYTRFLDLKKAEAQARDAQINLAVERVRARALAMFKSEEIIEVVAKLKDEIMGLNIPDVISATIFLKEGKDHIRMWDLTSMEKIDGVYHQHLDITFKLKAEDPHLYVKSVWENTADYFVEAQGAKGFERLIEWMREHNKHSIAQEVENFVETSKLQLLYHATKKLDSGKLAVDLLNPPPQEMQIILTKMGAAFDLAYKRFEDLQKAEAQTREAEIELALERVRSQAMAMKESGDLLDIVVTMRKEFTRLGHQAGYFWHMMWLPDKYEKAMTSGDGTKIGFVMELPRHIHGNIPLLAKWEKTKKPTAVYAMDAEEAIDYVEKMISLGDFKNIDPQAPTHEDIRHIGGLTFIMARTTHGEIGYSLPGVVENPPKEDVDILIRFAGAFDIAHRRFLDLQQAEAQSLQIRQEKERLEVTLIDLRATQSQLIQSEKMASLGELTAGIAHEIQNPLNFVNNFSEVNQELISELIEEVEKGNTDEIKSIALDIKDNSEKINHHGKRADAIVKGMLQHSRSSSGKKEPTDINALADEYLRLSYHGLRAKDKSFNATMKTDYDSGIGSINIIPQDVGRVLLNLFTNAFYSVKEKKTHRQAQADSYEPTVSLSTKKINGKVEIRVMDNGMGIPKNILDKLYQPFFTTKPTGQGTGLGLSMSYDIITKGHGGEIRVETKEGEFAEFVILLPA